MRQSDIFIRQTEIERRIWEYSTNDRMNLHGDSIKKRNKWTEQYLRGNVFLSNQSLCDFQTKTSAKIRFSHSRRLKRRGTLIQLLSGWNLIKRNAKVNKCFLFQRISNIASFPPPPAFGRPSFYLTSSLPVFGLIQMTQICFRVALVCACIMLANAHWAFFSIFVLLHLCFTSFDNSADFLTEGVLFHRILQRYNEMLTKQGK